MDWQIVLPFVYYGVVAAVTGVFLMMREQSSRPGWAVLLALLWPLTLLIGLPALGLRWAVRRSMESFQDLSHDRSGELSTRLTAIEKDIKEMKAMTAWLVRRAEQGGK